MKSVIAGALVPLMLVGCQSSSGRQSADLVRNNGEGTITLSYNTCISLATGEIEQDGPCHVCSDDGHITWGYSSAGYDGDGSARHRLLWNASSADVGHISQSYDDVDIHDISELTFCEHSTDPACPHASEPLHYDGASNGAVRRTAIVRVDGGTAAASASDMMFRSDGGGTTYYKVGLVSENEDGVTFKYEPLAEPYTLATASSGSPEPSNTAPRVALINALAAMRESVLGSDEEVGEVFGDDVDPQKLADLRSLWASASAGEPGGAEALDAWLPRLRMFDPGTSVLNNYNGADTFVGEDQDGPPSLMGAYKDETVYASAALFEGGADAKIAECVMVQELAHHIDHSIRSDTNDPGSEGVIAALKVCDHGYDVQPEQIAALQDRQDKAVLTLQVWNPTRGAYDEVGLVDAELGFWKTFGIAAGLVLVTVVLPEAAPFLLEAEVVVAEGEAIGEAAVVAEGAVVALDEDVAVAVVVESDEALEAVVVVEDAEVAVSTILVEDVDATTGYYSSELNYRLFDPAYVPADNAGEIPDYVYHGFRGPGRMEEVFSEGLQSPQMLFEEGEAVEGAPTQEELLQHQYDSREPNSRFISTSKTVEVGKFYNPRQVMVVRPGEGAVDVNDFLGSQSQNLAEYEVAIPNHVPTEQIYGMYDSIAGTLYLNPGFVP